MVPVSESDSVVFIRDILGSVFVAHNQCYQISVFGNHAADRERSTRMSDTTSTHRENASLSSKVKSTDERGCGELFLQLSGGHYHSMDSRNRAVSASPI